LSWNGYCGLGDALVGLAGSGINFDRALHLQGFVRAFGIELHLEGVELSLLLQEVGAGGSGGFFLQRQVHALMAAVLLRVTGLYALNADAQSQPPDRQTREVEKTVGRSERHAVIGTNRLGQPAFFE